MLDPRTHARSLGLIASLACGLGGCSDDPTELRVTMVDGETGQPVAGALAAIEEGGIYVPNADLTRGNPSYQYGAQADASGVITLPFTSGTFGLHVFADGYLYAPKQVKPEDTAEVTMELSRHLPDDARPVVGDVTLDPATVARSGAVTVRATVAAGVVSDPELAPLAKLSEEVLLIDPASGLSFALDPPAPGCSIGEEPDNPRGCPDGEYSRTFTAPAEAGTRTYYFVVSSEGCVTSDPRALTLVVE